MKKVIFILCCFFAAHPIFGEINNETEYPGDHFSLEGAVELFAKSESIEEFESKLNEKNNDVNNLDLNEDGQVDYIRVIDHMEKDVHAIVLQVSLSEMETQDVAVIEIERTGDAAAMLQIVGNEEVYGEEVLVEPFEEEVSGKSLKGPNGTDYYKSRVTVNVWFYPSVQYIYRPSYRPWVSPFRWNVHPKWWKPWRPLKWTVFRPRTLVWKNRYHRVTTHRVVKAHRVYVPKRTTSVKVSSRTAIVRTNNKTFKKNTTVVKGSNGKVAAKTTKSGIRKNPKTGKVKAGKKTTKVAAQKKNGKTRAVKKTKTVKRKKGN